MTVGDALKPPVRADVRAKAPSALDSAVPCPPALMRKLMTLRDEFVEINSRGVFCNAAEREWSALPQHWRMVLLLLAGLGGESADDYALVRRLEPLAQRGWAEMPPPERESLKIVIREGKRAMTAVRALATYTA